MAAKPFDPTKPVTTRSGRPARIITTNANGAYPIVALVPTDDGNEWPENYTVDGHIWSGSNEPRPDDLVNAPDQRVVYAPIRVTPGGRVLTTPAGQPSYETSDEVRGVTMDAILKVIVEDGNVAAAEIVP